ncbi:MAG: GNAT family N-acetyltransferase [Gammaproteobacteria bacterium]|nr:MAG: GNAT family N-acetyltransferase [Gammaproteobacteria bacterium]
MLRLYIWDEAHNSGFSITIFTKAIFKIGYLGFPVGGTITGSTIDDDIFNSLKALLPPGLIHILRIPSGICSPTSISTESHLSCPETYIPELGSWTFDCLSKHCRRDIKKATRENEDVNEVIDPQHCTSIYKLYENTIRKNDGSLRYNEKYFKSIIIASKNNKEIRITCIKNKGEIIAFLIVALSNDVANYLHGAINYSFRKSLPNDLLIYDAIMWAKNNNAKSFNLMCSPNNQLNLVKYKEKWGGTTSSNITIEHNLSLLHSSMFKMATSSIHVANKFISKYR